MTPEDIKRIDELHAISTSNHDNRVAKVRADSEFFGLAHHLWPAISAELTRLREFEDDIRFAINRPGMQYIYAAIDDLDRKRGEHDPT